MHLFDLNILSLGLAEESRRLLFANLRGVSDGIYSCSEILICTLRETIIIANNVEYLSDEFLYLYSEEDTSDPDYGSHLSICATISKERYTVDSDFFGRFGQSKLYHVDGFENISGLSLNFCITGFEKVPNFVAEFESANSKQRTLRCTVGGQLLFSIVKV